MGASVYADPSHTIPGVSSSPLQAGSSLSLSVVRRKHSNNIANISCGDYREAEWWVVWTSTSAIVDTSLKLLHSASLPSLCHAPFPSSHNLGYFSFCLCMKSSVLSSKVELKGSMPLLISSMISCIQSSAFIKISLHFLYTQISLVCFLFWLWFLVGNSYTFIVLLGVPAGVLTVAPKAYRFPGFLVLFLSVANSLMLWDYNSSGDAGTCITTVGLLLRMTAVLCRLEELGQNGGLPPSFLFNGSSLVLLVSLKGWTMPENWTLVVMLGDLCLSYKVLKCS